MILYTTEDGQSHIQLRASDGTVWLSQLEIAQLFQATKQNISLRLKNIYADDELELKATVKDSFTVQIEGGAQSKSINYALQSRRYFSYRLSSAFATWGSISSVGKHRMH